MGAANGDLPPYRNFLLPQLGLGPRHPPPPGLAQVNLPLTFIMHACTATAPVMGPCAIAYCVDPLQRPASGECVLGVPAMRPCPGAMERTSLIKAPRGSSQHRCARWSPTPSGTTLRRCRGRQRWSRFPVLMSAATRRGTACCGAAHASKWACTRASPPR